MGGATGGQDGGSVHEAGAGGSSDGGDGGGETGSAAGAAGASTEEPCVFPTPITYPDHCFDRTVNAGESGTDCGGAECAPCSNNQACRDGSDCLSKQCSAAKTCTPLISFGYTPIDVSARTPTPKFKLTITYSDSVRMPLRDLKIRYYFNHGGVTEPIIGLDSQATIDPGNSQTDISPLLRTSVHRFPPGPVQYSLSTDSYLEIGFEDDSIWVTNGTKFVINQDFIGGSSDKLFDQGSHYSFMKSTTAIPNEAITVYRAGQRLWGVEPPLATFPSCAYAFGANMNGPALSVSGEALLAESDAHFTFNGTAAYTSSAKVLPTTDASTTSLLGTGQTMNTGDSLTWPVSNGKYWAYAWLASAVNGDTGTLKIGSSVADKFFAKTSGGARWGLIGPYAVEVLDGSLSLTVDGTVHVAGVKLYTAQADAQIR